MTSSMASVLLLALLHPTFVSANFTIPGSNTPTIDGLAVGTIEGGNTIDELLVMNHATPEEILFNHKFPGPDSHSLRFAPHFNRPPSDGKYAVTHVRYVHYFNCALNRIKIC